MVKTEKHVRDDQKGGLRAAMVWLAAAIFYLYEYLVRVAPSVMEGELEVAFNTNSEHLAYSLATYAYIYAPMQLIVGLLFDRFGGKRLLVPATLVVAFGCYIVTFSESLYMLTVGRFLMGFGSAFGFVGTLYMATIWYPLHRIAFLSGLTTALGMLGAILGQTVLSAIVEKVGWEMSWIYSAWAGFVVAAILMIAIPKTPSWERERRRQYISNKERQSFLTGLFIVCRNPQTWIIGFIGGALFLPNSLFADLWGIQYIMHVSEVSRTQAGAAVSMVYLGWLIGSPLAGWLSDHLGKRKLLLFWGTVLSAVLLWGLLLFDEVSFPVTCGVLFLSGVLCSVQVISFVVGIESNSIQLKGTAIAVVNMIVTIIGGLCQPIVGRVLRIKAEGRISEGISVIEGMVNTAHDYRLAMWVLPAVMLIGALLCLFLKETYRKGRE